MALTRVTSDGITDGSILNADLHNSAAIAGTKISPDFGSQAITTTGNLNCKDITLTDTTPGISFVDSNNNSDFRIIADNGVLSFADTTNNANRINLSSNGTVAVQQHLDVGAGVDVTGITTSTNGVRVNTDGSASADYISVGASQDLKIYHDGSHSYIRDIGTGGLRITTDSFNVVSSPNNEAMITATENGAVNLYHDHNLKLATNSSGVSVTGNISCSGTVDGVDIAARNTLFGGLTSSSGVLSNGVTATTQSAGNNTTRVATTAFVTTAISNLVDSSPSALNTLNELAAALGDDANFSTTVTNSIATKLANIVEDTTPQLGGTLQSNGHMIRFADATGVNSNRLKFGTGDDLHVYHNGSNSTIRHEGTGSLLLTTTAGSIQMLHNAENMLIANPDGAVDLYHNNSKKFETTSLGVTVTGGVYPSATDTYQLGGSSLRWNELNIKSVIDVSDNGKIRIGDGDDLQIYHDGTSSILKNTTGALYVQSDDTRIVNAANSETIARFIADGAVELYHNSSKKFETTSSGATVTGTLTATSFSGDGSNLTGVTSTTINNNANNRVITGSNTANTLEAESGLLWDSVTLTCSGSTNQKIILQGATHPYIHFYEGTTGKAFIQWHADGYLRIKNDEDDATIRLKDNIEFSPNDSDYYKMWHANNDGSGSGLDADTVDGIQGSSFIRSDTADTASGDITFSGGAGAITLTAGSDIRMTSGTWTGEHAGKIQYHSNKMYIQGGSNGHQLRDNSGGTTFEINPSGTCAGVGLTLGQTVQHNADATFNGGAGAVTIAAHSDIRLTSGNWTGNAYGKIQHHSNHLYFLGGNSSDHSFIFRFNTTDRVYIKSNGTIWPQANNTSDLGTSSNRWNNIYTNDLNLSNEGSCNDVDGTWGSYTIQEGAEDLFLVNRRNGKKYKFNLTEVS